MKSPDQIKLEKELQKALKKDKKTWTRFGIEYSWHPQFTAIDNALMEKKEFAIKWRKNILDVVTKENGLLEEDSATLHFKFFRTLDPIPEKHFRIFKINNIDRFAVCGRCSPYNSDRFIELKGETFEENIIRRHVGTMSKLDRI